MIDAALELSDGDFMAVLSELRMVQPQVERRLKLRAALYAANPLPYDDPYEDDSFEEFCRPIPLASRRSAARKR